MSGIIRISHGGTPHRFRPVVMQIIFARMMMHLQDKCAIDAAQQWEAIGDVLLFVEPCDYRVDSQLWHALKLAVEELLESGPTDADLVEIYGDNVPAWVQENLRALHNEMMATPPGMTAPPHG